MINPECSVPGCVETVRAVCACDLWCLDHFLEHIQFEDECRAEFEEQQQIIASRYSFDVTTTALPRLDAQVNERL